MSTINVIVPVYKVEPYLRRCVDSILVQTFTNFELILVDDGSPDNCGAICDEYIDPRITVIHQKNGGLSAARNAGIDWAFACSDSEWLAFVDSDDWVHPQYLEYLYRAVCENDVRISVCEYEETDSLCSSVSDMSFSSCVLDGIDFFASDKNVVATVAWNKLYRKELFTNLRYPVGKIHEDEYTTYKLLYQAGKVAYVKAELYNYYINPLGITKKKYSLNRLDALDALERQCDFFREKGMREYYDKWLISMILYAYPLHEEKLNEIGENGKAELLRRRGRKIVLKNLGTVKKMDTGNKDRILSLYFPCLNHFVMPLCNFLRMILRGGLQEAVQYYKRKNNRRKR